VQYLPELGHGSGTHTGARGVAGRRAEGRRPGTVVGRHGLL